MIEGKQTHWFDFSKNEYNRVWLREHMYKEVMHLLRGAGKRGVSLARVQRFINLTQAIDSEFKEILIDELVRTGEAIKTVHPNGRKIMYLGKDTLYQAYLDSQK